MKYLWLHSVLRTKAYQRYMKEKREAEEKRQEMLQDLHHQPSIDPWNRTSRWAMQSDKEKK